MLSAVFDDYLAVVTFNRLGVMTANPGPDNPQDGITVQNTEAPPSRPVVPSKDHPDNPDRGGDTIKWEEAFWQEVPWYVTDDQASRLMDNERLLESQMRSNVERLAEDADQYVYRQWAKGAKIFQDVTLSGDDFTGFAPTKELFQSQYTLGVARKLNNAHVPRMNRIGILNDIDEGNLLGLDPIALADQRGRADLVPEYAIGRYRGADWYGSNNLPEMTNASFGAVVVNGDHAVDVSEIVYDGGGIPTSGDIVTFAGHTTRYKIWKVKNNVAHIYPGLSEAVADDVVISRSVDYTPSLIGHKDAFGYAPVDMSGDASFLEPVRFEQSLMDSETLLNMRLEIIRQNSQTLILVKTRLYAGPNKYDGCGILAGY